MAEVVVMPRQGQSVESCIITQWFKKVGDPVEQGEVIFSYETDKAAFDEEAEHSGILLAVLFEEGDEVPVLSNVAVIGKEGEDISQFSGVVTEKVEAQPAEAKSEVVIQSDPTPVEPDKKVRISPRAKKMADSLQLKIDHIEGSGPMGRIIATDVEKLASAAPGPGNFIDEKISNVRRIIAEKMHQSLSNSAQLTHHTSADARKILMLRKQVKEGSESRLPATTTLNDMVCFSIVKALGTLPEINAHFLGDTIRRFREVNLGIAVDTERGLMVPALKNADKYELGGLGDALKELADSCKKGTIDPDLLLAENATFTVSNLGAFGVEMFTPIINLPQSGIMGVNTIIQRPAELGDGSFGFIPHIGLSLSYDHRSLDGAPASLFLQEVKNNIENFDPVL